MSCIITNGYSVPCSVIGGAEAVYLGNWSGSTTYSLDGDNVISGATNALGVFLFDQEVEVSGLEQTTEIDRGNLSAFFVTTLTLRLHHYDKDVRNTLVELLRAPLVAGIVSNQGDTYWAGSESPGRLISGTAGTGIAYSDMNGAEIQIEWRSKNGVYLIEPSVIGTDIAIL